MRIRTILGVLTSKREFSRIKCCTMEKKVWSIGTYILHLNPRPPMEEEPIENGLNRFLCEGQPSFPNEGEGELWYINQVKSGPFKKAALLIKICRFALKSYFMSFWRKLSTLWSPESGRFSQSPAFLKRVGHNVEETTFYTTMAILHCTFYPALLNT